ncbi:MAG: helicase-associated domain-containing protein [Actinomycetota bacterium]|nr:helicase-associated domain-containing protein [Actinomycetota bacterium]
MTPAPRSLAEELRGWPDERLARLLQARPDLATPVPPDLGVLAARAGVRLSVLRALEQLDAAALAVVDALALHDEPAVPLAQVRALVGPAAEQAPLHDELQRLRDLALVWGPDDALHLVGTVRELVGASPAGLGRPVAACLAYVGRADLAVIAQSLGLPCGAGVAEVAELFADRHRLPGVLAGADERARGVLAQLVPGPPYGQVRDAQRPLTPSPESPVRWLLAHALLVAVDLDTVELPREVGLALRGEAPLGAVQLAPPALDVREVGAAAVDRAAAHTAGELVQQTEALLEHWAAVPPSVLRAGGVGVRDLRRTAKELDVAEPAVPLLVEVAAAAGLLDQTPGLDPGWVPTTAYDAWLGLLPEQRWAALAQAWLDLPRLPGLAGARDDRDKVLAPLGPGLERPGAPDDRHRVLDVLAEARPGSAPTRDSALHLLLWRAPRRGGRLRDLVLGQVLDEAESLGFTGRGALAAPSRLLRAGDASGAARALGALLPAPVDHVLVQPDLTVVAPGPLERDLAQELALVADVESTGGATVYRVSGSSVRRALDAGRSVSDLLELFRSRSRTPVPQALTYLVEDVGRRHGRLRVGTAASYLRCDDEALLAEVLAAKRARSLQLRRLAPTVLTSSAPVPQVLEDLRAAGYAPAAEAPDGALLLARPEARRTPARARSARYTEPAIDPQQAALAVTALRAGDVASRAARRAPVTTTRAVPDVLAFLQDAARDARQVWLGYVDAQGRATSRVVEPRTVEGGYVRAYDHLRHEDRTFSVHRITGVADLDVDAPA